MSAEARRIWRSIVPELDRLDLLTIVDMTSLEGACSGAATARFADKEITQIQKRMARKKSPHEDYTRLAMLNNIAKRGWQQWKSFATEFGLTPASRSRINLEALNPGAKSAGSSKRRDPIEDALCG